MTAATVSMLLPVHAGTTPEELAAALDSLDRQTRVADEVVVVEPSGSETQIVVRGGGQEMVAVFRDRFLPHPGETIRINPDPNLVHLFDAETGQRLIP